MEKPKAKYRKNDVIMIEGQMKAATVVNKDFIPQKGWLYTLKVVGENEHYKRYYENRINEECSKLKNAKAVKVLYGNSKKS